MKTTMCSTSKTNSSAAPHRNCAGDRQGIALFIVLIAVVLISLSGFAFRSLMFAEREGAWVTGRAVQSRSVADSGVEMARTYLERSNSELRELGGVYNNENLFRDILVVPSTVPRDMARFSIFAPAQERGIVTGIRYGLENESTRLNVNALLAADSIDPELARKLLTGLPGMTNEIADAVLDWVDADDTPRTFGAEADYYSGLDPPYKPKNGPIETVEELLMVKGMTPQLLFGGDKNHNGMLDPEEAVDGAAPIIENAEGTVDNTNGVMDCGLARYLTVYSGESNLRPDGTPRININSDDLKQLHADLVQAVGDEAANFIVLARQNTMVRATGDNASTFLNARSASGVTMNLDRPGPQKFTMVLDLIGMGIQLPAQESSSSTIAPLFPNLPGAMLVYMPLLMNNLTINTSTVIPGRININQAPRLLIEAIPNLPVGKAEQILSMRIAEPTDAMLGRFHETWLLSEGIVTLDQMKSINPFVTCAGSIYRAQVVGFYDDGGPTTRLEAIIDATQSPSRLLFWRELSHLGQQR